MEKIIIIVSGGLIQAIQAIPPNVVVEVHDYDTDGAEQDEEEGLVKDEQGDVYQKSEWAEEGEKHESFKGVSHRNMIEYAEEEARSVGQVRFDELMHQWEEDNEEETNDKEEAGT